MINGDMRLTMAYQPLVLLCERPGHVKGVVTVGPLDTPDHHSSKVGVDGIRNPRWIIVLNGIMFTPKGQQTT